MCKVSKFCGCASLKIGCIVIGALGILWAFLPLAIHNGLAMCGGYLPVDIYLAQGVLHFIVWAIIGSLLIAGAVMGKKIFILPWLILSIIFTFFSSIIAILGGVSCLVDKYFHNTTTAAIMLLEGCLEIAIQIYFFIVVYSFYRE